MGKIVRTCFCDEFRLLCFFSRILCMLYFFFIITVSRHEAVISLISCTYFTSGFCCRHGRALSLPKPSQILNIVWKVRVISGVVYACFVRACRRNTASCRYLRLSKCMTNCHSLLVTLYSRLLHHSFGFILPSVLLCSPHPSSPPPCARPSRLRLFLPPSASSPPPRLPHRPHFLLLRPPAPAHPVVCWHSLASVF